MVRVPKLPLSITAVASVIASSNSSTTSVVVTSVMWAMNPFVPVAFDATVVVAAHSDPNMRIGTRSDRLTCAPDELRE
ncbi:Uncharacterised protein [Mycobacteroides abscessus subsp. abscessus]|nr:Uncharacterised protein [Mycobacteroides abscessus subsp. abscessus]